MSTVLDAELETRPVAPSPCPACGNPDPTGFSCDACGLDFFPYEDDASDKPTAEASTHAEPVPHPPNGSSVLPDLLENIDDPLEEARKVVAKAIQEAVRNPTAHLKKEIMEAFKLIREHDALEYETARTDMKQANRLVRMEKLDEFTQDPADDSKGSRSSLATTLADLASEQSELWHDKDGAPYLSFHRVNGSTETHLEHWPLDSEGAREWLAWLAHKALDQAPGSETLKACTNALSGKAKFDGPEHEPAMRVAKTDEGYWLDLCDETWRAIRITEDGYAIEAKPAVRFIRTKAMRPLVLPSGPGDLDALWSLINVPEDDRPLLLAWLLESMRPDTPYPVLELIGEQGSAKSTTQTVLRSLLDPNKVMLRGRPKTVDDVYVAAGANHIISHENLSSISPEISDAYCTISTGGGQAGRRLYTNADECVIKAHNPIMLNGIGAVVTRPDLLDRAVSIGLPVIGRRITETEHAQMAAKVMPGIMAGLLALFVQTLKKLKTLADSDLPDLPRMADFAYLGEAMHQAQGGEPGQWLARYKAHRQEAIRRTIDASPVAQACIEFVESGNRHRGTVKQLLTTLNARSDAAAIERGDYWPRSPKGLGDALRRAAPALRQIGVHLSIETKARRDGIHCELWAMETHSFVSNPPKAAVVDSSEREEVRL